MNLSAHQPNFFPWLGYFVKVAISDIHVILDDVEFSKNNWINRNIIDTGKNSYLTIPVNKSDTNKPINQVRLGEEYKFSINKIIKVDLAIVGDVKDVLKSINKTFTRKNSDFKKSNKQRISKWWEQIQKWRSKNSLHFNNSDKTIKPQHAVQRLYELTKDKDTFITTEVGQHQMWAAQHYKFNKPNRWMTSGGLGTMGYGLPAAVGVQIAHPKKLVIDIAGEASVLMTMQEMSTAVQYNLPIKIFILNNQYMGMVRQWQELLHEKNYSESYSEALPDFIKLAEAYGCKGIKAENPSELDEKIEEMVQYDGPVIFDCRVDPNENCFPMIPSGKPHNQMILGPSEKEENKITGKGKELV